MTLQQISVGTPYPSALPIRSDGAIADFLHSNRNLMIIALTHIQYVEAQAAAKGVIKCGILQNKDIILLLWQFYSGKDVIMTFDTTFDARLIENMDVHKMNDETRLVIELHMIDRRSRIVHALRHVTMSPTLTQEFMQSVANQLESPDKIIETLPQDWQNLQPFELVLLVDTMHELGA